LTKEIEIYCNHNKSWFILTKISNCPTIKTCIRYYNVLRKVIQNAKDAYYSNLLLSSENKTEVTWNNESGKVQNMNHTPSLFQLNNTYIHIDQAAETFNKYFPNLVDSLKVNNGNIDTAISLLTNLYPVIFQRCYPSY